MEVTAIKRTNLQWLNPPSTPMNAMGNPQLQVKENNSAVMNPVPLTKKYAMQIKNQKGRENWEAPLTSIVLTITAIFTVREFSFLKSCNDKCGTIKKNGQTMGWISPAQHKGGTIWRGKWTHDPPP